MQGRNGRRRHGREAEPYADTGLVTEMLPWLRHRQEATLNRLGDVASEAVVFHIVA